MKIAVCVPHTGTMMIETAQSLAAMTAATVAADIKFNGHTTRPELLFMTSGAGSIDLKRTRLAAKALDLATDYLLWIDTDQTFQPDALVRLMGHDKPIVGGNYPSRHGEPVSTAIDLAGKPLRPGRGLEEVGGIGFGFCLFHTSILRTVPRPWFTTKVGPKGELICGEDVHFCNQARAAGFAVYVDHDLTIGHIVSRAITLEGESDNAVPVLSAARV